MTMTKQDKWVFAKEMVDKGHTQVAVAEMLNVSKTTITSYLFKAKYEIEARERAKDPKTMGDLYLPRRVRNALHNHSVHVGPENWLKMTFDEFFSKSYSPQWMADNIRDLGKAGVVHLITQLNKAAPEKADAWC
jgi:DNA-binding transcriptional regulator LsrR (DeoR family)